MNEAVADERLLENLLQGGVQVHWSIEDGWGDDFTKIGEISRLLHHFSDQGWLANNLRFGIRHFGSILQYFFDKIRIPRVSAFEAEKKRKNSRGLSELVTYRVGLRRRKFPRDWFRQTHSFLIFLCEETNMPVSFPVILIVYRHFYWCFPARKNSLAPAGRPSYDCKLRGCWKD